MQAVITSWSLIYFDHPTGWPCAHAALFNLFYPGRSLPLPLQAAFATLVHSSSSVWCFWLNQCHAVTIDACSVGVLAASPRASSFPCLRRKSSIECRSSFMLSTYALGRAESSQNRAVLPNLNICSKYNSNRSGLDWNVFFFFKWECLHIYCEAWVRFCPVAHIRVSGCLSWNIKHQLLGD